jgi:hypothetical protein
MLLHQKLVDCANWVESVNVEMERGEEKCARHHHQTMLEIEMEGEVNVGMGEGRTRSTYANLPNDDFRGCTSELARFS